MSLGICLCVNTKLTWVLSILLICIKNTHWYYLLDLCVVYGSSPFWFCTYIINPPKMSRNCTFFSITVLLWKDEASKHKYPCSNTVHECGQLHVVVSYFPLSCLPEYCWHLLFDIYVFVLIFILPFGHVSLLFPPQTWLYDYMSMYAWAPFQPSVSIDKGVDGRALY